MVIVKPPRHGGEVTCHQDAAFLLTDPPSVVGFWVALEDATVDNGCLWVEPGGHRGPLRHRFERHDDETRFVALDDTPYPEPGRSPLVPVEADMGTLVLLHGLLPHWSDVNRSDHSRLAYTVHAVDAAAHWSERNWLRRGPELPFRGWSAAPIR